MNIVEEHVKADYVVKLKTTTKMQSITAWFPKNLILDLPEQEYTYLIENNIISIFSGKKKIETFECPSYATRMAVGVDIIKLSQERCMSDSIITAVDESGNKLEVKQIAALIPPYNCDVDSDLETQVKKSFEESIRNPEFCVPSSIRAGFEIIIKRYLGDYDGN